MADANNFSDINENFDTIKTLLNSIRAQGILNTSDVDKLLEGINSKLEKINTEEDIDLIKAFLSELKKNLDERHEVLISKFGAIESLFSNLLKNSSDTVKSEQLKELFDIVATNLSVFSREVVSQKETLTDITLRLDAMRSDDSQKKDIIKSVTSVRNDIEKVNNGFDSIVISLNENFKTVLKTISEADQSEAIQGFSSQLSELLNSSNTILSAIQLIDKKNIQFEDSFEGLATQEDLGNIQRNLAELSAKSQEIINIVDTLTQKSYKIDNLAEKIDASVNIIAGLKAEFADKDSDTKNTVLEKLSELERTVREVSSNQEFEEFKDSLETVLKDISNSSSQLKVSLESALNNIEKLNTDLKSLDINANFRNLYSGMDSAKEDVKEKVVSETEKVSQMLDANITRAINEISSNAEVLNTRLKDSNSAITAFCEKSFHEVAENITNLKDVVAQLDENNISANNAIFSNITDRLAIFENSLKTSLEKQEDYISGSSNNVFEQITNMKSVAEGIDYKLDANAIEFGNTKREFHELTESINNVLALDFVNVVKDLKVELYASKQDLANSLETVQTELSENFTNDLFGKYELLISKLDSLEDEMKYAQADALNGLKTILSNISSSIVDILSYVSTAKEANNEAIESKLSEVTTFIQDSNLNYIENVRDIVDVIRVQVEENLNQMNSTSDARLNRITASISEASNSVRQDIKATYDKLLEMQNNIDGLKEFMDVNNISLSSNIDTILSSADSLKGDFDSKLSLLKNSLLDMVTEFKKDFTCENADKISELKFNSENLHSKAVQQAIDLKNELKTEIDGIISALRLNISNLNDLVTDTSLKIEGANREVIDFVKNDFTAEVNNSVDSIKTNTADVLSEIDNKVADIVNGYNSLETSVNNLSNETTKSLTGTLAKILDNFVSLDATMRNLDEQSAEKIRENAEELSREFDAVKKKLAEVDSQIDEDLARQISIIEGSFESLNLMLVDVMNQATDTLGERIRKELSGASSVMSQTLAEELEQYKVQIEELFEGVQGKNNEQAEYIKERAKELNQILSDTLSIQNKDLTSQLEEIGNHLKDMIHENVELTSADYESLKIKLDDFVKQIGNQNNIFVDTIRAQLDDIAKFVDSNLDIQAQEVNSNFEEISSGIQKVISTVRDFNNDCDGKISGIQARIDELKQESGDKLDEKTNAIIENLNSVVASITGDSTESINGKLDEVKNSIENLSNASQSKIGTKAQAILDELASMQSATIEQNSKLRQIYNEELKTEIQAIDTSLKTMLESGSVKLVSQISGLQNDISENIQSGIVELRASFENLNQKLDSDEAARNNIQQDRINELSEKFNNLVEQIKEQTKSELNSITEMLLSDNNGKFDDVKNIVEEQINRVFVSNSECSATELQSMEAFADELKNILDSVKQNSIVCKDLITNLVKERFDILTKDIEKEADILVGDLIEQCNLIKDTQKDELSALSSALEGSVAGYVIDAVNDLKSYLDVKTDTSMLDRKMDTLRTELEKYIEDTSENINKLIDLSVFTNSITDLKATNEVLITSMTDKLNKQIQDFISTNVSKRIDEKVRLLDKKFIDTIVDKYEEVKILTTEYNKSFERISNSVQELVSKFVDSKDEIKDNLSKLIGGINKSVDELKSSFADLKAQIMNKSFDEAFHSAVQNQMLSIEALVREQLSYIEDVNELCASNLPELLEMNTLVKYGIQQSVNDLKTKIETQDVNITQELNKLKSDIITQFLNIFNQISFVAEQEEIIDFIDEKHSELITILSHIVTTVDGVETVKDNLAVVDNKIDSIREDIDLINEKITSIMSSEGDIDYVYSLQDLESDIANLRLVLNDIKNDNKSKEFEELINSTNSIYEMVEAIKTELPKFEAEEFKKDFNNLAEDIVSISTRTNKLILTSDESYKTLQDNLQDFKLVIDDLDERTRNFAHEAGIDRIDNKLGAINTMIQNGAKTNQVFNQVFEYLAEWVDRAGEQISSISDKVETLDDIGQIKVMLEDLRAEAHDNSESEELVNALESVFDKQAKRIASMESKIDRMVVDATIKDKKNKVDMKPIEDTLNKFLAAIGEKISSQQEKIDSLEAKLEEVVSLVDNKDTAQLTKKVGGMDRQLAKLNKSIEKIASNVVEK